MSNKVCPTCGSPLMKIDHYGEVLIGCVHCNYWRRPGDKRPIMEMLEDDETRFSGAGTLMRAAPPGGDRDTENGTPMRMKLALPNVRYWG